VSGSQVFISGYFGFGNLGDEAILEAAVAGLRRRRPADAIAASFGPERRSAERLGVQAVDFFGLDATVEAVGRSDLVLFGLGGVFQDYWGASAASLFREGTNGVEAYARPALLARMAGVPAVLFCGGIGPLRTPPGRAMFRMACEAAARVYVRDQASAEELRSIVRHAPPEVVADPAHLSSADSADRLWAAEVLAAAGIPGDGTAVAVAARAWDFFAPEPELAARWARALAALPAAWPLVFIPCHCGAGTDDRAFAERIRSGLGGRRTAIAEVASGGQAVALFERCALVVAARNHGLVLAGCAGVPAVGVCYDPKVAGSAQALGTEALTIGLDQLERLAEKALLAAGAREAWARTIAERRQQCLARLDRAFAAAERLRAKHAALREGRPSAAVRLRRLPVRVLNRLRRELRALPAARRKD
jgi:polysaccharide pyruvyl transferase CsaB